MPRGLESVLQLNPQYQNYHPIADPITNPEPLPLFTNGAGYTVSYGRDTSEYGFAHGVVNAALAVELAKQWHLKDQNLPAEKTYLQTRTGTIRLRAAEATDEASGEFLIPGALTFAEEGFAEYFNEFFKEPTITAGMEAQMGPPPVPATPDLIDAMSLPFHEEDPPFNTRGGFDVFDVPAIDPVTGASNVMAMEWAEVHVTITGDANALNYVKMTLVSPDGTHSELLQNHYNPADINLNFQNIATRGTFVGFADSITPMDEGGGNSDTLDFVFSTNRIWGERSDSRPVFDEYGNLIDFKGWELHYENYSGSDLEVSDVQIAFHGSPVGSSAGLVERVMGKVGVDSGRFLQQIDQVVGADDGEFNFDRYISTLDSNSNNFYDLGSTTPIGLNETRIADGTQEQFAGNITVYAIDNDTGLRVAQFLTGYDGNYYFDLPEGEYTIGVEDPLSRDVLDNDSGYRNYDNEWVVTIDTTDDYFRTAGAIDPVSGKFQLFDNLNFLLDPGVVPAGEVVFTGQVIADLDADGTIDDVDIGTYNLTVYADLNHTGKFEVGEPFVLTDVDGNYELHVPTGTPNTFSIGVDAPGGWTVTAPASIFRLEYAAPGELTEDVDFLVRPALTPTGQGNGYVFGFIFDDRNGDGIRQDNEHGLANRTVFIDANLDGDLDAGEISTLTNSNGAYQFGNLALGTVRIDTLVDEPYKLNSPAAGYIDITLTAGAVSAGNFFAVQNLALNDFGDLGGNFQTNSATHFVVPGFRLGATIDAEVRPRNLKLQQTLPDGTKIFVDDPTKHGTGDDQVDPLDDSVIDDEDGVVLVGGVLRPGANTISVTVSGVGGYLQVWIDFNDNGTFESGEQVYDDLDLNQGTHQLLVNAPQSLVAGQVAARFRWGNSGIAYFGPATIGEIEDYLFDSEAAPLVLPPGDYNGDQLIDQNDYRVWKTTFGSTVDLRADGNKNGVIDIGDYTIWRNNLPSAPAGGAGAAAALAVVEVNPAAAAKAAHDALAYEISMAAWQSQAGNGSLPARTLSFVQQHGGQLVEVEGLNGTSLRAILGAGSATGAGAGVELTANSAAPVRPVFQQGASAIVASFAVDLSGMTVSPMLSGGSAAVVKSASGSSASHFDSALLLTAAGLRKESSDDDNSARYADLAWAKDEANDRFAFELAIKSAFDDDTDWWLTL